MTKVSCSWVLCQHNSSSQRGGLGACKFDGEIRLDFVNTDREAMRCNQYRMDSNKADKFRLEEELKGWTTSIVDDLVRAYETRYAVTVSDECEEPTLCRPFWTYGLEDGGYLQVIPSTDSTARLEQYLDEQLVRKVVYRDFDGWAHIEGHEW